jgi:cbb3-type cytochrome oxidase maturation protein
MNILYLLVPLASLLALGAALAFVWSAKRGQLDDLVTPALRMLHDDEPIGVPRPGLPAASTRTPTHDETYGA